MKDSDDSYRWSTKISNHIQQRANRRSVDEKTDRLSERSKRAHKRYETRAKRAGFRIMVTPQVWSR